MFKKALIASAVLAATSGLAFANGGSFVEQPHHTGNFYVGVGVSRDTGQLETTGNHTVLISAFGFPIATIASRHQYDWGGDGVNGELFVGYNMVFQDRYTLGLEVFGSISSLKGDASYNSALTVNPAFANVVAALNTKAKWELENSFGISLLPGIKLSDSTTLYGRIGWVSSRFKVRDTGAFTLAAPGFGLAIASPVGYIAQLPFSKQKRENGIQLGLGMNVMVTNNVSLRGEYDYVNYSSFSQRVALVRAFGPGGVVTVTRAARATFEPHTDQFKLAAIYHFNV